MISTFFKKDLATKVAEILTDFTMQFPCEWQILDDPDDGGFCILNFTSLSTMPLMMDSCYFHIGVRLAREGVVGEITFDAFIQKRKNF